MMMTTVDVIDMVVVLHGLMAASGAMLVVMIPVLSMGKGALVPMVSVGVMGMALVYEVGMAFVLYDRMSTGRTVGVVVVCVNRMISCTHDSSSV
jgi:hypothetical protein